MATTKTDREIDSQEFMKDSLGKNGGQTIASSDSDVTGDFCALVVVNDCVFTTLTRSGWSGSYGSNTVLAGTVIYGYISAVTLASGIVDAYNR